MRIAKVVLLTFCSFALTYWLTVKILKKPKIAGFYKNFDLSPSSSEAINFQPLDKDLSAQQALKTFFFNLKKKYGFNGNVLIGHEHQVVYEDFLGHNGWPEKSILDSSSVFQIASLSKQFTAIAILQLVEQGRIELDKPFSHYFPNFPYTQVTVEMLLTHRSGLTNYMYFCDEVCNRKQAICNDDVLDLICQHRPVPYFPPGKRFDYSNTGYALLASLVEKITGLSFPDYAHKFLFKPLNMQSTIVYDKCKNPRIPQKTRGFDTNGRPAEDTYLDGVTGDKGIYTTARDLFRWSVGLDQASLLSKSYIQKAWTPKNPELKQEENYGYGFRVRTFKDGKKVVYHAGWWHGYHALFMKLLHNDVTIIILTNRVNWSIKEIDTLQSILNSHYPSKGEESS